MNPPDKGTPSKSVSVVIHAVTGIRVGSPKLSKQRWSSASRPAGSFVPASVQAPPSRAIASHHSKWPISSEKAILRVWAAHTTRVCSLDVEYIEWKAADPDPMAPSLPARVGVDQRPVAGKMIAAPTKWRSKDWMCLALGDSRLRPSPRTRSPDREVKHD